MRGRGAAAALAVPLLAGAVLVAAVPRLPLQPGREEVIAAYSTSLRGRAPSQVHNLRLAVAALDGAVVAPGREMSFNRTVGPWTADRGYRRAPVSFSGDLVLDWGGGVCQASTTLYNAALLAGLPILERHRHHWPATYVPAGQDAAVAYPGVDLRLRNNLQAPVRISARIIGDSVVVRLRSRGRPPRVSIERQVLSVTAPAVITRAAPGGKPRRPVRGQPGCQVAVYRVFEGDAGRELVSRDTYPPLNRVTWR